MVKYTPENIRKLIELVEQGSYAIDAALEAGISEKTYYEWLKDPSKGEFRESIKKARATAINERVRRIRQAGEKGAWQADAWYLERVARKRFGRDEPMVQQNTNITLGYRPESKFIQPIDMSVVPKLNTSQIQRRQAGVILGKQAVAQGKRPGKKGKVPRKKR